MMAACDLQRPAAVDQLQKLGQAIGVAVFAIPGETNPLKVARKAMEAAREGDYNVLLVDTAGRLHLDEELMYELEGLKKQLAPREILLSPMRRRGRMQSALQPNLTSASRLPVRFSRCLTATRAQALRYRFAK